MAIEVDDLVIRFPQSEAAAVRGLTMRVRPGEVVALLGPNGAGKTTTLNAIEGYLAPDSGQVRVLGHDPRTERHAITSRWGVMPQSGGLPMGVTVGEAIKLFAALHGVDARVPSIIEATGLDSLVSQRWRRLSGGEQQRLSLALALCGGSDVLILDEPTNAVDAAGRERILKLIAERAASGSAVLVTTHRFDDVERVADRVVILHHGASVAEGTLAELTTADHTEFQSAPGLPFDELAALLSTSVVEVSSGTYRVERPPTASDVATINQWLEGQGHLASSMLAGRQSLESLFLALTADGSPS